MARIPAVVAFTATLALAACQSGPSKEEIEAARQTIDCMQDDERIVIRFDEGEARLLMPDGTRVVLYQVPTGSGVRYLNGTMELRGRSLDMELTRNDRRARLQCKRYEIPAKKD
jgi:membrane-bound inhibitor of C-type lysozyme